MKIARSVDILTTDVPEATTAYGPESTGMVMEALSPHVEEVTVTIANTPSELEALVRRGRDVVWNGFSGNPAVPSIAAHLEEHGLNFVGSTEPAMRLARHKERGKRAMVAAGLRTAPFFTAEPGQYRRSTELPLGFPLFVKPLRGGAGAGIDAASVVRDFAAYEAKVESVSARFGGAALVEEYLSGREFTVSLLEGMEGSRLAAIPVELIALPNDAGDRVLGAQAKLDDEEGVVPVLESAVEARVGAFAVGAFRALGARDYGRIDIRMDEAGRCCFLEANLMPEATCNSYFARACRLVRDMDYETVMMNVLRPALNRCRGT